MPAGNSGESGKQPVPDPLYPHQQAAVDEILRHMPGGFALFPEQRTGKTRIAIEVARRLEARRVLVLCPSQAGNVPRVWVEEAAAQWPGMRVVNLTGPVKERAAALQRLEGRDAIVICNYESVWRPPLGPERRKPWSGVVNSQQWDVLICDEIHRVKDHAGAGQKAVASFAQRIPVRLGLTGTPMHSPLDVWGEYNIIDPSIFGSSFVQFRMRYTRPAEMREWRDRDVTFTRGFGGVLQRWKYRDLDDLERRMWSIGYRILLHDAFPDMPPMLPDEVKYVELEPAARRAYREIAREMVTELEGGTVTAANAAVKVQRLQQLCGGTLVTHDDFGGVVATVQVSAAKESLLREVLIDIGDKPVVVFGRFHTDLDAIHRAVKAAGSTASELSGRRSELQAWQAGETQVLVAQIQAGGSGISLARASTIIYYSAGYSLIDHQQSRSRILGPKQTEPASYVYLIAVDTADGGDEAVYAALAAHEDVVQSIIERVRHRLAPAS